MKKKKKGRLFDAFAILIAFASLFFNILLLYNIMKTPEEEPITSPEITKDTHTKKELGEIFKKYQSNNNLAFPDKIVEWEVDKITYRGFFKKTNKKLYYITEKYTCVSGSDCVTAANIYAGKKYAYNTTFVVSIDYRDRYDLKFEILDYSIEDSEEFVSEEPYDLE